MHSHLKKAAGLETRTALLLRPSPAAAPSGQPGQCSPQPTPELPRPTLFDLPVSWHEWLAGLSVRSITRYGGGKGEGLRGKRMWRNAVYLATMSIIFGFISNAYKANHDIKANDVSAQSLSHRFLRHEIPQIEIMSWTGRRPP